MSPAAPAGIAAVLFDKDGTLFDFRATWDAWAARVIAGLSEGSPERAAALAEAAHFDLDRGTFLSGSPIIAGTNREAAACLASVLPDAPVERLEVYLSQEALAAPLVPPVPLDPCLEALRTRGLALGVMTNDAETVAQAHLETAGVAHHFDFIAGFDSGYGAKPDPGPLLAFARSRGLAPERVVMVGDSRHDLIAAQAAGMVPVAVLTGVAVEADLEPLSAVVLEHIGHLEAWLFP